eukprot:COSAG01_NODE_458_length_16743_cov_124.609208_10_plen_91_part_00
MNMQNGNMMSKQKGNTRWKEMAASIAASGQLDKTADQIRGHVHTQRFQKAWDSTVNHGMPTTRAVPCRPVPGKVSSVPVRSMFCLSEIAV